ncbi:MAG TPA: SRPBCC family protein [Verrucomicrobiae bacterium]|nr:SRPBCC family protein [Verrucomicrobiae bacterium]
MATTIEKAGKTRRRALAKQKSELHDSSSIEQCVTINRGPQELYQFWRNFENLPRFMEHLTSVRCLDERRSHWVVKAPLGKQVEWEAEIINDEPGQLIAWQSLPGADVVNAGTVRFEPAPEGRGTLVRVLIKYDPPGGMLGAATVRLSDEHPQRQVREDLERFKQLMEAGETESVEGES